MPLAAAPDCHVSVARPVGGGGVRLYVALMDGAGGELALDDYVRLRESVLDVADAELEPVGEIGRSVGVPPSARSAVRAVHREQALVENRRAVRQRVLGAQNGGQDFVIDVDEVERALGDGGVSGGDGGDGVSDIQRLLAGDYVAAVEAVVDSRAFRLVDELRRDVRQVGGGDDGADSGQRLGARCVYPPYARVGMGASEQLADQHSRQMNVRAVPRPAGHFVQSVMPNRARPDGGVLLG